MSKETHRGLTVIALSSIAISVVAVLWARAQGRELKGLKLEMQAQRSEEKESESAGRAQMFALGAMAAHGSAPDVSPASPPPTPPAAEDPPSPQASPPAHLDAAEMQTRFADVFDREPVDGEWARDRTNTLTPRVRAALPASSALTNLECHSSMCRIETAHDDVASARSFMNATLDKIDTKLTTGASFSTPMGRDARGRLILVQYVAAEGKDLPHVAEAM